METVTTDVACTRCGCVCDDLEVTVADGKVVRARQACSLAEPWFLAQPAPRRASAEIEGQPVSLEAGIARAAELLRTSRFPLLYGLSRSSTIGQRAAVRLADRLGAVIDTTASTCHAPSIMAIQEVGESTCTLGEIRNRADLVVFWGSNPVVSHPRHLERYAAEPIGQFVAEGRAGRTLAVVDHERTATAELADHFLQIQPGHDFEALSALRMLIRGIPVAPEAELGVPLDQLADLARRMKECRCGVVFFGLGLAHESGGHRAVELLLRLVTDLNAFTRFHAKRMRVWGDVAGADSVLCWQTGFPFAVNLARGYPRYGPGEYSAGDVLRRGEADVCLLVGSEGLRQLPAAALDYLRTIPLIALDYASDDSIIPPTVRFTTAVYGVDLPGTAYRMDEVPIPLRSFLQSEYPGDHDILAAITAAVG